MTNNMPFPVKLVGSLIAVIVTGLVLYLGAALHVYIIAWVVALIGIIAG